MIGTLPDSWEKSFSYLREIAVSLDLEEHPLLNENPQEDRGHKGEQKDTQGHAVHEVQSHAGMRDDPSGVGRVPGEAVRT